MHKQIHALFTNSHLNMSVGLFFYVVHLTTNFANMTIVTLSEGDTNAQLKHKALSLYIYSS